MSGYFIKVREQASYGECKGKVRNWYLIIIIVVIIIIQGFWPDAMIFR